jgi:glycosyltransferase involved in cell wall biosynthesis
MKITFMLTLGDAMGGTERAIFTQAEYLARNHDVEILSVFRTSAKSFFAIDPRVKVRYLIDNTGAVPRPTREHDLDDATCQVLATASSQLINPRWENTFNRLSDLEIEQTLRSIDTDILVSSSPGLMAVTTTLAPPHVITVHQEHRPSQLRVGTGEPLQIFTPRLDALVVLTERTRSWFAETLQNLAPRLEIIPNSVPEGFRPKSTRQTQIVTIAARAVPDKQIDHAIRAFAKVVALHPDWQLRILGDGPRLADLRRLADGLGIHDNVQFFGRTQQMAEEWSKASIVLLTSRDGEALPLVLLEAFAAGVPAISYDCQTGPAEIITHGVDGFIVGPGDTDGLAARIIQLIEDPQLRHRLGAGALAASERYDLDKVMGQWTRLYTDLMRERAANTLSTKKADRLAAWIAKTGGSGFGPAAPRPDRPLLALDARQMERLIEEQNPKLTRSAGRLSIVSDTMTPREVSAMNLHLVTDALDQASLPYWVLRDQSVRHRVAISVDHRDAAIDALTAVFQNSPVYAETFSPSGALSGVTLAAALPSFEQTSTAGGLRVYAPVVTSTRTLRYGGAYGCDLEFWRQDRETGDHLPMRRTLVGDVIAAGSARPSSIQVAGRQYPSIEPFSRTLVTDVPFPIDAVYTWVDGADPAWIERKNAVLASHSRPIVDAAGADARFRSRDELMYSIRSVEMFAPWINHIWLVTDQQVPEWLDLEHPRITVVDHKEIFGDRGRLPTFNSHAIESQLHRIEGLAEHFLYFNDDVFLGRPLEPSLFFQPNGVANFFQSPTSVPLTDAGEEDDFNFAAAKNNRRLIEASFGRTLMHSFLHVPHALRVSVLRELSERFADDLHTTAASQFRSAQDLAIPSSLHHYFGYFTGRSARGAIRASYVDLGRPEQHPKLTQILTSRGFDVFCLNDTHSGEVGPEELERLTHAFLSSYFPIASEFERGSARNLNRQRP